ncbi:MAG: DUF401 family protein [Desulfovibrio sp.]|uniref:DUF401 family protein n=1 Tax=Desulfovibrio sp. 7SRBS1 TaxID=3378064 RepID=UPI003B41130F
MVFLFGKGPVVWLKAAGAAFVDPKTIFLLFIVAFIMVLSSLMEKTGRTGKLMDALSGLITNPRLRLVFFPALIGLLPMPGGAIFSAPLIEKTAEQVGGGPMDKTLLNYWFRHLWEPSWPLYPGIILAAGLAGLPIGTLCLFGFPGVVMLIALGWWFFLRPSVLPLNPRAMENIVGEGSEPVNAKRIIYLLMPLLTAIVGSIGLEVLVSAASLPVPMELGVVIALGLAVVVLVVQERTGMVTAIQLAFTKHVGKMLLVILAVFVFKESMQAADVVTALARSLGGEGALWTCAVVLPLLVGFVSGITLGVVGATFPLLLGLLARTGMQDQTVAYVILALFSGYCGILASPLHICFALTCEYFHVEVTDAWKRLIPPSIIYLLFGIGYFLLLLKA